MDFFGNVCFHLRNLCFWWQVTHIKAIQSALSTEGHVPAKYLGSASTLWNKGILEVGMVQASNLG